MLFSLEVLTAIIFGRSRDHRSDIGLTRLKLDSPEEL